MKDAGRCWYCTRGTAVLSTIGSHLVLLLYRRPRPLPDVLRCNQGERRRVGAASVAARPEHGMGDVQTLWRTYIEVTEQGK